MDAGPQANASRARRPRSRASQENDSLGQSVEKREVVLPKYRAPGNRGARRRRLRIRLRDDIVKRHPELDASELDRRVQEKYDQLTKKNPDVEKKADEIAPVMSKTPVASINETCEIAAVMRLPQIIWLRRYLERWTAGPKGVLRRLVVAVILQMGLANGRPSIDQLLSEFTENTPVINWQHFYPGPGPSYKTFCKAVERVLERDDHGLAIQINADLVRQTIGELIDDGRGGKSFSRVPRALMDLLVDGQLVESWLPQTSYGSEREWLEIVGQGRRRCRFIVYAHNGVVTRRVFGYKAVVISDLASGGLPLVWALVPATADEREVTLRLLSLLFELFPELSELAEINLVGDALYDYSEQFNYELVFRWGINPCFPQAGQPSSEHPWHENDGVPRCGCRHHGAPLDMKLHAVENFPSPAMRRRKGWAAPGEIPRKPSGEPEDSARLRWKCPTGIHDPETTYIRENPRLYTSLPRTGDSGRALLRQALCGWRQVIESGFAELQRMGFIGEGQERPRWAEDLEMDWLISLGLLSRTARRLVHQTGGYEDALAEAEKNLILTQPTATCPAPSPGDRTAQEAAMWIQSWMETESPPSEMLTLRQREFYPEDPYAAYADSRDEQGIEDIRFQLGLDPRQPEQSVA
jgi:hypothetical protein